MFGGELKDSAAAEPCLGGQKKAEGGGTWGGQGVGKKIQGSTKKVPMSGWPVNLLSTKWTWIPSKKHAASNLVPILRSSRTEDSRAMQRMDTRLDRRA